MVTLALILIAAVLAINCWFLMLIWDRQEANRNYLAEEIRRSMGSSHKDSKA